MAFLLLLTGSALAAGGGTVTPGPGPIALDGFVDGAYAMLDEDTYAAPIWV